MQYQLPPWLGEPAHPAEKFIRGAQAGSEWKTNFIKQQMMREQQQRDRELHPIRRQLMDNEVKSTSLAIERQLLDQDRAISTQKGFSSLAEAAAEISRDAAWAKPSSLSRVWEIASKVPSVILTPQFGSILTQSHLAQKASLEAERLRRLEANDVFRQQTEVQKLEQGERGLDLREEGIAVDREAIAARKEAAASKPLRLDQIDSASMQAELRSVFDDARLSVNPAAQMRKIEAISQKWRQKLEGGAAAPATNTVKGVTRFLFDPTSGSFK